MRAKGVGLGQEMEEHPWRDRLIRARGVARGELTKFLQMYPFRENPAAIETNMVARRHAEGFITWLERNLRWLGGINLHASKEPHRSAGSNLDKLRRLLHITVDPQKTPFQKVDAGWDAIPWFGSDRHIAKKIVATYYPEHTLPIFSTEHLEHFVSFLSLRPQRDSHAKSKFGRPYGDVLTVGQKWEVLSQVLLAEKAADPVLQGEDNVWFMYCLYYGDARPPGFEITEPP